MKILIPSPPPCPRCAGNRYVRERFFRIVPAALKGGVVILGRCENCSLRRFMLADGGPPPLWARPRWVPARLLKRVLAAGPRAVLLAPAGTDIFSNRSVSRLGDRLPMGPLDLLWFWLSLEEHLDVSEALVQARGLIRPGGMLRVTAVNAEALGLRLALGGSNHLDPLRQRVLFTPDLLADFLRDAGFKRGRISFNLVRPTMQAKAFAPE